MTGNSNAEPPEPDNPVQNSTMDQYKAVFRKVHKQQSAQRVTSSVWEQIWTLPIENLHKLHNDAIMFEKLPMRKSSRLSLRRMLP
jgi:hypothetical protein